MKSLAVTPEQAKLVEQWIPAVHKIALQYADWRKLDLNDCISTGMIGLIRAAQCWKPEVAKFSTYAFRCIKSRIGQHAKLARGKGRSVLSDASAIIDDHNHLPPVDFVQPEEPMDFDPFHNLSDRDRAILQMRSAGVTLQEIADNVGVTRERVRQICDRHVARLSDMLALEATEELHPILDRALIEHRRYEEAEALKEAFGVIARAIPDLQEALAA